MIPKIIHYCWISGEENMPDDIKACIESWHKYLPDYQFINWNDSNFDWNICEFTKNCRENNLYAFCSDYVRFWALYNYGGIYLDSDVMVYKSFDELLKLKRVITSELYWSVNDFIEAAIIGSQKGDKLIGKILDWYNNTKEKFSKSHFIVAPGIINDCCEEYYISPIKDINDECTDEDTVSVLDANKFFNHDSEYAFAQHQFKGSWWANASNDCTKNDDLKIFLCAHKPIENYIPKDKKYVILDVTGNADNSFNDNFHDIIDISDDEFVKSHNVSYSEGAAMYWLWKHPDIIPEYICFGHYRRMFLYFSEKMEKQIPRIIDRHGAIIAKPWNHEETQNKTNIFAMYNDHFKEDTDALIESIKEVFPEYCNDLNKLLYDKYQYAFNCFAMKKEDFLKMCDMCFNVLARFDEKRGYINNETVSKYAIDKFRNERFKFPIGFQLRINGYYLEWLTDLFYRHNFDIEKCYKCDIGIPEIIKSRFDFTGKRKLFSKDNLKIFLCAHKPIENHIPKDKKYTIIDVTGNADNSFNDNFHDIIDISNDEFVKTHNICYSEGCAMKWLCNHPDVIPEYICFCHYRRMFCDFILSENNMQKYVDNYGAIIPNDYDFTTKMRINNKAAIRYDHPRSEINIFIKCVEEVAPEYLDAFKEFLQDKTTHPWNCFVMRKDDFLEMCEFCFRVLGHFDKKQGYKNNEDVKRKMQELSDKKKLNIDKVDWQSRLQGFLLEYLTDTYYRYKYGVKHCYKSNVYQPL